MIFQYIPLIIIRPVSNKICVIQLANSYLILSISGVVFHFTSYKHTVILYMCCNI